MPFPIKPLADRVIIKLLEEGERKSPGGIVLGTNAKYRLAEVVAVGRGVVANGVLLAPEVSPGDLVQILAHGGDEITVEKQKYLIMPERSIIAAIDKKATVTV